MFTALLRSISWSRISHGPCQRTPGVQRANRKLLSGSHFVEPGVEYRADRFRSRLEADQLRNWRVISQMPTPRAAIATILPLNLWYCRLVFGDQLPGGARLALTRG